MRRFEISQKGECFIHKNHKIEVLYYATSNKSYDFVNSLFDLEF